MRLPRLPHGYRPSVFTTTLLGTTAANGPLSAEALAAVRGALPVAAQGVTPEMVDGAVQRWAVKHGGAHEVAECARRQSAWETQRARRIKAVVDAAGTLRQALYDAERGGDACSKALTLRPDVTLLNGGLDVGLQELRELTARIELLERAASPSRPVRSGAPPKAALQAALNDLAAIYADATGRRPGRSSPDGAKPGPFERFVRTIASECGWPSRLGSMDWLLAKACRDKRRVAPTFMH